MSFYCDKNGRKYKSINENEISWAAIYMIERKSVLVLASPKWRLIWSSVKAWKRKDYNTSGGEDMIIFGLRFWKTRLRSNQAYLEITKFIFQT